MARTTLPLSLRFWLLASRLLPNAPSVHDRTRRAWRRYLSAGYDQLDA